MLWTGLLLQKLGSKITVITFDRVMVLTLCASCDGSLSMYQVSINSLIYFQIYPQDKLFNVKIRKGSNFVATVDRVMVFAFCNFPHSPLSVYQVSLNYLQYFQRYAPDKFNIAKIRKEISP